MSRWRVRMKVSAPGQEVLKERRREATGASREPAGETPGRPLPGAHFCHPCLQGSSAIIWGETS